MSQLYSVSPPPPSPPGLTVRAGMAVSLMILKQAPKARNFLKTISKMDYDSNHAAAFEQAWLYLANQNIAANKHDVAQELCDRCLKFNQSCARAWELLGLVREKDGAHADAARAYENAWRLENDTSPV
jgi:tetratricopeptide repeat protein 21B